MRSDRYLAHVWTVALKGGMRVTHKRRFGTEAGARRFAAKQTQGDAAAVAITEPSRKDPIGPRIAYYQHGLDTLNPGASEPPPRTGDDDMGTPVTKPATSANKARPKQQIVRKNPISVADLLAMTDRQIEKLPVEKRPELPTVTNAAMGGYAPVYARFLSGERKLFPNPWMSQTSADDGRKVRTKVRKAIGEAAKVKVGNADGTAASAPKADKPAPAAKPAAKPAASKPAAKKAPAAAAPKRSRAATTTRKASRPRASRPAKK